MQPITLSEIQKHEYPWRGPFSCYVSTPLGSRRATWEWEPFCWGLTWRCTPKRGKFVGWTGGDGDYAGYREEDYWDGDRYLGPDQYGVEPEYEAEASFRRGPNYASNSV